MLWILGLILFVGLVIVHEYGHYKAARRNGVEVEEFGIGFPPKAKTFGRKHGTEYTLNWLPLGGFVRLKGEHDADTEPGSYGAASLRAKIKILLAGVFMNLITALGILTILAVIGMPKLFDDQFTVESDTTVVRSEVLAAFVDENSPAAQAGLMERDELLAIGPEGDLTQVESADELPDLTAQYAGQEVVVEYERDGQTYSESTTLRTAEEVETSQDTDDPVGYLGVSPTEYTLRRSTWSAPIVAIGTAGEFTWLTLKGIGTALGSLFVGDTAKASEQVAGPVGIFVLIKDGSLLGYQFILMIVAVISLTLAIMNALPIPALDGGKLFVTLLYRALKKPLTPKAEEWIHGTGFFLLMLLFVLITIVDVRRFF
jgi:regulator of sigma E protease